MYFIDSTGARQMNRSTPDPILLTIGRFINDSSVTKEKRDRRWHMGDGRMGIHLLSKLNQARKMNDN